MFLFFKHWQQGKTTHKNYVQYLYLIFIKFSMHFLYGIDICYDVEFPLEHLGIIPDDEISCLPCVVLIIEVSMVFFQYLRNGNGK